MPQFVIQSIQEVKSWSNAYGENFSFIMSGLLDGQVVTNASINAKDKNKYQDGQIIDVSYTQDQYGYKLKRLPPALPATPGQQAITPETAQNVPQTVPRQSYDKSSEREFIIRQNALSNAVAYCTAKAGLMTKEKGEKYLEGKKVLEVAHYFAKFSLGDVPFPTHEKTGSEVFLERHIEEPLPEPEDDDHEYEASIEDTY